MSIFNVGAVDMFKLDAIGITLRTTKSSTLTIPSELTLHNLWEFDEMRFWNCDSEEPMY